MGQAKEGRGARTAAEMQGMSKVENDVACMKIVILAKAMEQSCSYFRSTETLVALIFRSRKWPEHIM